MLRGKTLVSAAVLAGVLGMSATAFACTQAPPTPPSIHVVHVSGTTYCIWVCNYTTFGAPGGTFCTCALNKLGVIANIKDIDVFYALPDVGPMPDPCNPAGSLTPVMEWTFNPNPNVGPAYQAFAGSGIWEGLLAPTLASINNGRAITIKFTVNVLPGVTQDQLNAAIQTGAPPFIGAGETDASGGNFVPGHVAVRAAGLVSPVPALGLIGLAVLGTGMAGAGAFAVRRRAPARA